MTLADLQNGDRLFIDANIFIYHFGGRSPECKTFLERCARRELVGCTATVNLAEVLHRLMIAEAVEKGIVSRQTAVRKLRKNPEPVTQLTRYHENVSKILHMNITILDLTTEVVRESAEVRREEGLLTNDSFVVAHMREQRLTKLATANGDFDRIDGIEVYKPADLEEDNTQ